MTQTAILDAFVRLLVEKGYAGLTIRDIALVAGVGLGTVYEYFPSKKSIAAHCIHQRFKGVGARMRASIEEKRGCPLPEIAAEILDGMLDMHMENSEEWSALIFLERQISDPPAYHALYQHIVDIWAEAFQASSDNGQYVGKSPDVVHAAAYGLLYQRLMSSPASVRENEFRQQLRALVLGYLLS
ncbi:TetR/AcrR family transcriptional regulator [Undibacterium terreum]|nr:TetR/AcrR family transcriptional regulator [Undibacterium terreum]